MAMEGDMAMATHASSASGERASMSARVPNRCSSPPDTSEPSVIPTKWAVTASRQQGVSRYRSAEREPPRPRPPTAEGSSSADID